MSTQISLFPGGTFDSDPIHVERQRYLTALLAPQSIVGYNYEWRLFERWCREHQRCALPASRDTVTLFLADNLRRGLKVSTARRRLHAIAYEQKEVVFIIGDTPML
jgi:hypothetical protein